MRVLVLVFAFLVSVYNDDIRYKELFEQYIIDFSRSYSADEYPTRYANFVSNYQQIEQLNELYSPVTEFGVNQFTDLSTSEFRNSYLGFKPPTHQSEPRTTHISPIYQSSRFAPPDNFDWRTKDMVTQVKNQAMCGSCWCFSAVGCLESRWAIAGNKLTEFSEQQILMCDKSGYGCSGGWMGTALEYVVALGGIESEASYRYTGSDYDRCRVRVDRLEGHFSSWKQLPSKNASHTKNELFAHGPVSVALNANLITAYKSGIVMADETKCPGGDTLNHGVLMVGYGVDEDQKIDFWIVKNRFVLRN